MQVREWGSPQPSCSWVSSRVSASVRRTHPTTGKDTTGRKRTSRPRWAWNWALTRDTEKGPNSRTPPASPGQIRRVVPTRPARGRAASASVQAHGDGTSGWLRQLTTGLRARPGDLQQLQQQPRPTMPAFSMHQRHKGKIKHESTQATTDITSKNKNLLFTKLRASEFITQSMIY